MSTATTTSHDTGQHTASQTTTQPTNTPTSQLERSAANRLRTKKAAVKLSFTWLGVRKTLAPEQRTTAARAFHADRELIEAAPKDFRGDLLTATQRSSHPAIASTLSLTRRSFSNIPSITASCSANSSSGPPALRLLKSVSVPVDVAYEIVHAGDLSQCRSRGKRYSHA
jgi:hypothetical protein